MAGWEAAAAVAPRRSALSSRLCSDTCTAGFGLVAIRAKYQETGRETDRAACDSRDPWAKKCTRGVRQCILVNRGRKGRVEAEGEEKGSAGAWVAAG